MELMKRPSTEVVIIEDQPIMLPQQSITHITNVYNVTLSDAQSWLMALAEMPISHVVSSAVIVGVLGLVVISAVTVVATTFIATVMGLGFYILIALALFLVAAVVMTAIGGK